MSKSLKEKEEAFMSRCREEANGGEVIEREVFMEIVQDLLKEDPVALKSSLALSVLISKETGDF